MAIERAWFHTRRSSECPGPSEQAALTKAQLSKQPATGPHAHFHVAVRCAIACRTRGKRGAQCSPSVSSGRRFFWRASWQHRGRGTARRSCSAWAPRDSSCLRCACLFPWRPACTWCSSARRLVSVRLRKRDPAHLSTLRSRGHDACLWRNCRACCGGSAPAASAGQGVRV